MPERRIPFTHFGICAMCKLEKDVVYVPSTLEGTTTQFCLDCMGKKNHKTAKRKDDQTDWLTLLANSINV